MNSATWVKFLAGVLLFAAWFALVLMRIVPPAPLVDAIGYALVGLGIYHASTGATSAGVSGGALAANELLTSGPEPTASAAPVATPAVQTVAATPAVQAASPVVLQ